MIRFCHVIWFCAIFWLLVASVMLAHADGTSDARLVCPTPGEKCKILTITEQEERLLMGQNGVLDTAAQARNLDLGAFVVYLKQKIAVAPLGEAKVAGAPAGEVLQPKDNSKPPLDK